MSDDLVGGGEWAQEAMVAAALGIGEVAMAALRKKALARTEWRRTPDGIVISKAAAERLMEEASLATEASGEVDATVNEVPPRNRHFVYTTIGGERVAVRVRDNLFFVVGMVMRLKKSSAGVWDLVGPQPRARGVW